MRWKQEEPRRNAIHALEAFTAALHTGDADKLLRSVVLPADIQSRTAPEQADFLTKALRNEISTEGLAMLRRGGQFGPLTNIFPTEVKRWSSQAGADPEDCVAFRLERDTITAEVVLVHAGEVFRVVRCNNVKQLAKNQ